MDLCLSPARLQDPDVLSGEGRGELGGKAFTPFQKVGTWDVH